MATTRRRFLINSAGFVGGTALMASWAPLAHAVPKIRVGACDTSMRVNLDPSSLEVGKRIGLDGVEIYAGEPADTLTIAEADYRAQLKANIEKTGIPVASVMMGLLNKAPLATDPRGPAWLEQCIHATADLGGKVILVAFFGKGDLRGQNGLKKKDIDAVVERIKEAAPLAQKKGVILGIENTLSGKDNMRILDRIQHDAVKIYYDVGNSTGNGYDVPAEIRMMGGSICQFHFKDRKSAFLGQGQVDIKAIAAAIKEINYSGWVVLETKVDKDRDADFKRNAAYTRQALGIS